MSSRQSGRVRRILTSNRILRREYHSLQQGDIFVGRMRLRPSEEHLLVDLQQRGIICFPSALSQLLSRSKTLQAAIFQEQMLPFTRSIHDQHDMLEAVNFFEQQRVGRVVTKHDRKNAGMGIHLWPDVENVFTHSSLGSLAFPFVIQPFAKDSLDIRVIILGEYIEAYSRKNPDNFRNNLHCGGKSNSCTLTDKQFSLCREVMKRGRFPYAHIDLMVLESGENFLAEINLRGGIRGAQINADEYRQRVNQIHETFLAEQ